MAEELGKMGIPVPEKVLRDLSKDPSKTLPIFAWEQQEQSVKELHTAIDPILETAEIAELPAPHRAATWNALCAIVDKCQASSSENIRNAVQDDSVWMRLYSIYLQNSENTKGKLNRQMLLTLSSVLLKNKNARSQELKKHAVTNFIEIINYRRDRLQVKPALQGLAYFLQKDITSIDELIELYTPSVQIGDATSVPAQKTIQEILRSFLSWAVFHDTTLSAGHLIKNFLSSLRRFSKLENAEAKECVSPLWIEPVVQTLSESPERSQEFKTHVFPHCFLPNAEEFLRFLSYLHFSQHVRVKSALPKLLHTFDNQENGLTTVEEFSILLAALQSGKELGVIQDVDDRLQSAVEFRDNVLLVPDSLFDVWLSDPEPEVRLAGLDLSVYSTAVTRPFSSGVLKSLQKNLVHLHTDTDANFRKEVLTNIQRLFERLKGSTATIAKSGAKKSSAEQGRKSFSADCAKKRRGLTLPAEDPLAEPFEFILWYIHFLETELRPTASYQRRITALRALSIVLKSGIDPDVPHHHLSRSGQGQLRWAHGLQITNSKLVRSLLDLVLDPFDDIRSAAIANLEICMDSIPKEKKASALKAIPQVINRAEKLMLRTGRADQADGLARAYSLLFTQCNEELPEVLRTDSMGIWTKTGILNRLAYQLEETIEVARKDLTSAVDGRPVHGTFAALRYILDQENFYSDVAELNQVEFLVFKGIHDRIRACFESLWTVVQDVLCVDAPEGHVPEEFDEEASLDTKEILSYSWRGLKEASVLIRTMVSKAPIGVDESSLLDADDVVRLGKLCFTQLVELRHRGAHSTVAQTFSAFCRRCMIVNDSKLRELPSTWYEETLLCIQDKATAITRRSAGIPSLITGILSAEHLADGPLFKRAIKDLFAEASQDAQSTNIADSRLPQVHALNSIKEIFTTSKLSATSEAYIGDGLDLAARTLNSSIWPIRNCGLMLFKALIGRLLGSDETQDWKEKNATQTSRFSYDRYPHLIGILKNLLDPNGPLKKSMASTTENSPMDLHGAEGVFPALQILRQAPPYDENRDIMLEFVLHLLSSPHWHLRDMAARTVVALHRSVEYRDAIHVLLERVNGTHNHQHGVLLTLKYMLRQYLRSYSETTPDSLNEIMASMKAKAPGFFHEDSCPFTKAAFIDLFNACDLAVLQQQPRLSTSLYQWSRLPSTLSLDVATTKVSGDVLLQRALSTCALFDTLAPNGSNDDVDQDDYAMSDDFDEEDVDNEDDDEDNDEDDDEDMDFGEMMAGMGQGASMEDIMAKLTVQGGEDDEEEEIQPTSDSTGPKGPDVREILTDLAANDADTCCDILSTLGDIITNTGSARLAIPKAQILSDIHGLILKTQDPEVVSKSQHVLAVSLADEDLREEFFEFLGKEDVFESIEKLQKECLEGPPSNTQSALHLMGIFLDFAFCSYPKSRAEVVSRVARYIRILQMTIVDTNPFDARYSAVQSVSALDGFWYTKRDASTTDLILGLSFVLYDMLNDDDDEIRDVAAQVTSKLLRGQGELRDINDAVPIVTEQRLGKFLSKSFSGSEKLCEEALPLLGGSTGVFKQPFTETLTQERKEDTALFTQEKQNLYKDDVMDVKFWANILSSVPADSVPAGYTSALKNWTLEGLAALTETAQNEVDGPLGWTSKAEVFTMGIRVICAADVVQKWEEADASKISSALRQLADAGAENELNGLWLEKIETVLEDCRAGVNTAWAEYCL